LKQRRGETKERNGKIKEKWEIKKRAEVKKDNKIEK